MKGKNLLIVPTEVVLPDWLNEYQLWVPVTQTPQPRTQRGGGSLNRLPLYYYHWGVKAVTCSLQHPVCIQALVLLQIYFQASLVFFKFVVVGIQCFFPQDKSNQPDCRQGASGWDLSCLHSCPWPADVLLLLCFWASPGEAACFMSCKLTVNLGEHPQVARLRFPNRLTYRLRPRVSRGKSLSVQNCWASALKVGSCQPLSLV